MLNNSNSQLNKNSKRKISVLAISYNHEKYIEKCVKSVFEQDFPLFETEMIIIDDGSSDNTCKIIDAIIKEKSYNITLIKSEHKGIEYVNARLNTGIRLCTGDYIMFIASDDGFLPNRFIEHIPKMIGNESLAVCISPGINIRENGRKTIAIGKKTKSAILSNDINKVLSHLEMDIPELYLQGMTFDGDLLRNNLFLNEEILADDWQFNIMIFRTIKQFGLKYLYVDEPVFFRNIHTANTSLNFPVHYTRISEMVNIYSSNPGFVMFRFTLHSLASALKNRRAKMFFDIIIFLFKRHFII